VVALVAELETGVVDTCELMADVSFAISESSGGGADWLELEGGIVKLESEVAATGSSDTAGAKTLASPKAEAAEPVWDGFMRA